MRWDLKSNLKTIIIAMVLVISVLAYFNHLSNRSANRRTSNQKTELESVMDYDWANSYPTQPRDVVKLHSRFMKIVYTYNLSNKEIEKLNASIRNLYSKDLLAINPEEATLEELKASKKRLSNSGFSYKSYSLPEASQIKYFVNNNREMASLEVAITVDTDEKTRGNIYIEYILIKENEQWKIYGWGESQLGSK